MAGSAESSSVALALARDAAVVAAVAAAAPLPLAGAAVAFLAFLAGGSAGAGAGAGAAPPRAPAASSDRLSTCRSDMARTRARGRSSRTPTRAAGACRVWCALRGRDTRAVTSDESK